MSKKLRAKRKQPQPAVYADPPTKQRIAHNDFERAGMAYRCVPMIDTLLLTKRITHAEHQALEYYRDQAHRAEDDVAEQGTLSPEKIMGGGCGSAQQSYIPTMLIASPAIIETARIERDLGSLLDIARAIAVDDWSLSRWCINRHGGRERYDGKGMFLCMVPVAEKRVLDLARLELRMAARRISR